MPKRPCEFDDDLAPQMKVHVGQREVNNGVGRETRMKKVYGKKVMFTVCLLVSNREKKFN